LSQNRKYPSEAAKRRKKEEDKTDEKCKVFLGRFVVVEQWFPTFLGLRHPTKQKYNFRHLVANP